MSLVKTPAQGMKPASFAAGIQVSGFDTSSMRIVTKGGMPRMTKGLRAAQTMLRQTRSSRPRNGPRTSYDIQS